MTTAGPVTRVAVDATALLGPRTGIGTFVAELIEGLATEPTIDTRAFVVSWSARGSDGPELSPSVQRGRRTLPARLARAAWRHSNHPTVNWFTGTVDLVHGPNFVVPPGGTATELLTIHDLTCVRFPELCTPDTLEYPWLVRRALERGAHVHAVSEYVAGETAQEFGLDPSRITVVPNGVSPITEFSPGAGRALAGADDYVLSLGTAEPRKDLVSLVKAFEQVVAKHPEVGLVVAGPDGWGTDDLDRTIAASPARQMIRRIARYVSDEERSALLSEATLLAYPSVYEGFGLPPLEAMNAGTPVVATRAGAVPEVVGDAALLTEVGDVDHLATAIHDVLDDTTEHQRLVEAGRERAAHFSWDRTTRGLVDLYRDLVQRG